MWVERNIIEYSTEDKLLAAARKKTKLILKLIWLHKKNKENITEYGESLEIEELEKLSLSNLLMMESQFSLVKKINKYDIDPLNDGQGESQA
jgi:hypothetical protein